MSKLKQSTRFLKFFKNAQTVYDVHSPFVFELANAILEDNRHYYAFSMIEPLRQRLLQNQDKIEVQDYGAGSQIDNEQYRRIDSIAKTALSPATQTKLLFRLINHLKPLKMLELGTSLGISTLYQAAASLDGQFITLEGSPEIAQQAQTIFDHYPSPLNINLQVGEFEKTLPYALKELGKLDYVFIDGNHRKAPTLDYFNQCYKFAHADSIFVFDDIHWSDEMEDAWEIIKNDNRVTVSIDLFFMGIIFFRKENKIKQDFKLVKAAWKPWSMGFTGRKV